MIIDRQETDTIIRAAIHLADEAFLFKTHAHLARLIGDCRQTPRLLLSPPNSRSWTGGYDNEFYFSRAFKKEFGVPPNRFRRMDFVS